MISADAIKYGFAKLENFAAVQNGATPEEQSEAFSLFLSSVGVSDDLKELLYDMIAEKYAEQTGFSAITLGFMLLGVSVGLSIAEYEREFS